MPVCKNCPGVYFRGDEASPLGRGYCSRKDPVGKRRVGGDKQKWVVARHGQSKRWMCVKKAAKGPKKVASRKKKLTSFKGGNKELEPLILGIRELAWKTAVLRVLNEMTSTVLDGSTDDQLVRLANVASNHDRDIRREKAKLDKLLMRADPETRKVFERMLRFKTLEMTEVVFKHTMETYDRRFKRGGVHTVSDIDALLDIPESLKTQAFGR